MITFELAKRLKEEGFEQKSDIERVAWYRELGQEEITPCVRVDSIIMNSVTAYIPTLEELIEAVGDWFVSMERRDTGPKMSGDSGIFWYVRGHGGTTGQGDSPEEAVAQLWLALKEESK